MAWTAITEGVGGITRKTYSETLSLPNNSTVDTSEIDFVAPNVSKETRYVYLTVKASAVSGTNIDIALYGAANSGGNKILLLDAPVADLTDDTLATTRLDLNTYHASVYYIRATTDANETANTITYRIRIE